MPWESNGGGGGRKRPVAAAVVVHAGQGVAIRPTSKIFSTAAVTSSVAVYPADAGR